MSAFVASLDTYLGHTPMRPPTMVENDAEIHAYFDNEVDERGGRPRAQLTCAWCGNTHRSHLDQMVTWFQGHRCTIDEHQASRNRQIMVTTPTEALAA